MDNLEKILFIEITCSQFGKIEINHPEFIPTWSKLTETEKSQYYQLKHQIHDVFTYINMPPFIPLNNKRVNSIFEYNEVVDPVDTRVLKLCRDFDISLKEELSESFKKNAKFIFGDNYFEWFEE